jgi:hypothetical protein
MTTDFQKQNFEGQAADMLSDQVGQSVFSAANQSSGRGATRV